ncbi:MAG: VWA domain-containing protein [Candidatus Abyssobacteria bacterium SURF_17]|uniref:VWA domain-containing protein n=1 Tax=Candidatus Abyssobacteria bacterium SURF_17 TaxID=2093361 RepID=A0A419EU34_9BACT|nr:MAG: VWA domain-containing protein [Candidatus Abyssubacteria bacterium SURF_17]
MRRNIKFALFIAAAVFLVVSLLGPRWGFHWEEVRRRGVEIVIALDTSESMLSRDLQPNRLERSKREVYDLIKMLRGDRVGLVVFAGGAFLQCPLTLDYGACLMFLDYIDTAIVPQKGTNLAEAITKAVSAFDAKGRTSKAIILISDGGNLQGDPMAAAQDAKRKGIKIYAIGVGREDEEAPIPLEGGFKYSDGKMVTTKLEDETLRDIALATGGIYVRSVTGDLDLEKIYYEEINKKMEKGEFESSRRKRWEERFQWPLFVAVAFLFAEACIGERERNGQA